MEQASDIFSQTVKDADQSSIHIQKRTDKGHGADVNSCSGTVKKKIAKKRTEKKKSCCAKGSEKYATGTCLSCNMADSFAEAKSLHFCHRWHSITEAEFVTVDGKRIRGRAIPVNTP